MPEEPVFREWKTIEDWNSAYNIGLEPGGRPNTRPEIRGHYERRALFNSNDSRLDYVTPEWSYIVKRFNWPRSTSIAIIGCGYGWSMEYLRSQGYAEVWGNDPSAFIQGTKDEIDPNDGRRRSEMGTRIEATLLDSPEHFDVFKSFTGHATFDVVVTERVLSSLTDKGVVVFAAALRDNLLARGGDLLHLETDGVTDPSFNGKTVREWKALLPNDFIVRSGGGMVL